MNEEALYQCFGGGLSSILYVVLYALKKHTVVFKKEQYL